MKRREMIAEIKKLSAEELKTRAVSMAEELMKLRFRKASGQLTQSHHMRTVRRNLARVQTQLSMLSKGITTPAATEAAVAEPAKKAAAKKAAPKKAKTTKSK